MAQERAYEHQVFLVRPLGFVTRTAARRINCEASLDFQAVHETVCNEHGFRLVDVSAGDLDVRVTTVERWHQLLAVLTLAGRTGIPLQPVRRGCRVDPLPADSASRLGRR